MENMEFTSEEERNLFIEGDREKRIELDALDVQKTLQELNVETQQSHQNLDEITAFYCDLDIFLRTINVGCAVFLAENNNPTEPGSQKYQLCWEDVPNAGSIDGFDITFWRIGYCKVGSSWHLAAQKYILNNKEGPKPWNERLGDPIRLTNASKELRLQAAHFIRDLLLKILEVVKWNKRDSDSSLDRIKPLRDVVWKQLETVECRA